jgi:HD-GYP domain-containing protein (c-di-GMP phosphodiesterase class II)
MDKHRLRLEALAPELAGCTWESNYRLRIGRLSNFEVVLTDSSVSRRHAEVVFTANGWAVRDIGSTNGTFVNGLRVSRAEEKLRPNDILQVGDVCLRVSEIQATSKVTLGSSSTDLCMVATANQTWDDIARLLAAPGTTIKSGKLLSLVLVQAGRLSYHYDSLTAYLQSLLWEVAESVNGLPCSVWLRDDKDGFLTREVNLDARNPPWQADDNDKNLARFTLQQGESVLFHTTARQEPATPGAAAASSVICAALRSQEGVFGVLQISSAGEGQPPFDRADLELADALALLLGAGIDNMRELFHREREMLVQSIATLVQLLNFRDNFQDNHRQRVTDYALLLAEELQLPEQERFYLRVGGPLHDLARVGIKESILHKPGPLDAREIECIRSSVSKAASVLESSPSLVPLIPIVRSSNERWDGNGYPDGLAGTQIPLLGRIVGLAAAFHAMTSERSYRRAMNLDQAFAEVAAKAGTQFDPTCVAAWMRLRPQIESDFRQREQFTRTLGLEALQSARRALSNSPPPAPLKKPALAP